MNPITLISNSVLELVGGNVYWFLFIILSLWLLFWLYKELRKEDSDRNEKVVDRLDKTLDTLGALESALLQYLEDTKNKESKKQLYDAIGSSYPYVTISLAEKMQGVFKNQSAKYGSECVELLREQIKILKNGNLDVVPKLGDGEMSSWFEHSFSTLTARFFKPFGVAFLILLFVYCFIALCFIFGVGQLSASQKGEIVLYSISIALLAIFILLVITLIVDGKLKQLLRLDGPLLVFPPLLAVVLSSGLLFRALSFILFIGALIFLNYSNKKRK